MSAEISQHSLLFSVSSQNAGHLNKLCALSAKLLMSDHRFADDQLVNAALIYKGDAPRSGFIALSSHRTSLPVTSLFLRQTHVAIGAAWRVWP